MTLIERARKGEITAVIKKVAEMEKIPAEQLRQALVNGTACIPMSNKNDLAEPRAVGAGTRVKVNANIGTSMDVNQLDEELEKLRVSLEAGADAVMDLSTGGDLRSIRAKIRQACPVPLGSVPMYEVLSNFAQSKRPLRDITGDELLDAIRVHAEDGIDFVTVHCGLTSRAVEYLQRKTRIAGVVSRGGSALARWIVANKKENPYYERFDEVLEIAKKYELTISLGDGLRPGCLADAGDRSQMEELYTLGELVLRCRAADVQVMVEGPGHVPLQDVEAQIRMEKVACHNAPFYVLGPLVTDLGMGHDHISGAIGGALAAKAGADFLCYLTPAEHLRLPTVEDVRSGVIASRIAAHAADIARGLPGARDRDDELSRARKAFDWEKQYELCFDPVTARARRGSAMPHDAKVCTMCAELCAMKGENGL